ncbi:uncharacterized protein MONOS_9742 [Monocercomonoides exilis]|uniref:uncharacterized protein n=1 Tax=Monocercomonoides exilis TaxID=2049356 RepID=UPI00355ACBFC|nr:hypothetical protein MONOS_9742 [Monocercomonoides exilis]|eukprot:MONOS_9742.1-p1 / transcript=MONOS_9742.1 / gene=MONOS_9742 / organism=Monocercomonoides_exilis_PA203 / gene_product=unspecified product / transcript_product=unspecified product / location=Mono_scaffold00414:33173-34897(-) / protein_length=574 / sequence_SO=supercontig / SO=protein_coding / is_pseudo=false
MIHFIAFVFVLRLNAVEVQAESVEMTTLWASDREDGIGCLTKAVNSSMRVVHAKLIGVQKGSIGEFVEGSEVILQDCVIEATNNEKSPFLLAGSSLNANGIELIAQKHGSVACFCENKGGNEELFLRNSRFDNLVCMGKSSFLPIQGKGMSVVNCEFNNATKQNGFKGFVQAPGCLETQLSGSKFFNCWNLFYGGIMGGMNVHEFASRNCSFCQCKHNVQLRSGENPFPPTYDGESFDSQTFSYTKTIDRWASANFTHCAFVSCRGQVGGGLNIFMSNAEVISCTFESCSAESGAGALCSITEGHKVTLKNSKFVKCSTTGIEGDSDSAGYTSGGAISIYGSCYLSGLTGEECIAGDGGFIEASLSSDVTWEGLTVKGCKTFVGNGWNMGGAMYFSRISSLTIKESLFQNCEAGFSGGALAFYEVKKASDLHVLNCKFIENKAIKNLEYFDKMNSELKEEDQLKITKEMCVSDIFIFENETEGKFTKDNFAGTTSSSRKPRTYSRSQGKFDNLMKGILSTGAIVGIVVGSVAGVIIIVVAIIIIVCVVRKKKAKKEGSNKEMVSVDVSTQEETS